MTRLPKTKKRLVERAEKHIFSTGINDGASKLCLANMRYGLAKIHYVQKEFGYEPDATFVTSPDETISRNATRWEAGFSYGGKLTWGSGHDKFIILDIKPNACGMLVGGLNYLPKPKNVVKAVDKIEHSADFINDIKVEWDFWKGNHFIDVFKIESHDDKLKLPKYGVILHAGCSEFKGPNIHGPGLYWNVSKYLMKVSTKVKTPLGHVHVLDGHEAVEYYKFFKKAEDFAKKRRALAFSKIFRSGKVILNETHQGMVNYNEALLGCNSTDGKKLLPVSIKADLPSYIMRGKKNFSKDTIDILGFGPRAEELGVMHRIKNANILPHGSGYAFPDSLSVDKVFTINNKRYFQIDMVNSIGKKIVSNMRELQFTYRGREAMQRTEDLDLGEKKATLHPIYTIKI